MTVLAAERGSVRLTNPLRNKAFAPVLGVVLLLVLWQVAAALASGRHVVPPPFDVVRTLVQDRFYGASLRTTAWEGLRGYVWGNLVAFLLAVVCVLVPPLQSLLTRLAVATYCTPTIAIGPLLIVLLSADTTKVIMSALSVFFLTLLGVLLGLASTPQTALDLVHVSGGSRVFALLRVRLRSAVPATATALSLAAPAALLGAMIGEYLGGDRGLGVVMVQAQQSLQVSRTWAVALLATGLSTVVYLGTSRLARLLSFEVTVTDLAATPKAARSKGSSLLALAKAVAAVLVVLLAWELLVRGTGLDPYIAKTPGDVWGYLTSGTDAASHRHLVLSNLGTTLRDAGVGYAAGTLVAVLLAAVFLTSPLVEGMFLPVVLALRSVPLVAMTPLVALVFGRGLLGVTVLAGAITLVPTLVNVVGALRAVPKPATDLLHAYAVGTVRGLLTVRFVYAVPALATSARIAVPGALLGAVLAELLATGSGLGQMLAVATINGDFLALWAGVAVLTAVSVVCYAALSALESAALQRLGR
ncbi:ABC-type nitrate/sulfonate/bicarbonate transport system permease component [Motilibacter rhizosphaerae]|uniref:ABC-type nitrate/sulfonate/bicarbonate transport system permease component n=1 Tax=Motilibacter rhizosphaerae TaxID=598652 RepID=A0A4Q7NXH4_9ACTN|nr:ABC transporter permease subunit [Motilibacter rhizosphaerae]RZS91700.1 ABC-type nitrate/sulfonate/bicarbonate transport system permease component [Motilibacter rhizosphaerae]